MNLTKSGFVLTEVLVSVIIVSLMFLSFITVWIQIEKAENHIKAKHQLVLEIEKIYTIFSQDPYLFEEMIIYYYGSSYDTTTMTIHYDNLFQPSDGGSNYIQLSLSTNLEYSQLTINVEEKYRFHTSISQRIIANEVS